MSNSECMNITIIGCGWLGQIVSDKLIKEGHSVRANYRSEETKDSLKKIGIEPFQFEAATEYQSLHKAITENTDVLILSLPPSGLETVDYAITLQNIALEFPEFTRVIFTSSTSVYPKKEGSFTESYEFDTTEKLNRIYLAEKGLRSILQDRLTILRLGGLIGPGRHPIHSLSGRQMPTNGSCPINLIDGRDIANFIELLIREDKFGELFNLVYPDSTPKKAYYTLIAKELGLDPPTFNGESEIARKVEGQKVFQQTQFKYQFNLRTKDDFKR